MHASVLVIALVPLGLFLADRLLGRFRLLDYSSIGRWLVKDTRPVMKELAEHEAVVRALVRYNEYAEKIRFSFHSLVITSVAAVLANVSCTRTVTVFLWPYLLLETMIVIALVMFLVAISQRKLAPPARRRAAVWERIALLLSLAVVLTEVLRHASQSWAIPPFHTGCVY